MAALSFILASRLTYSSSLVMDGGGSANPYDVCQVDCQHHVHVCEQLNCLSLHRYEKLMLINLVHFYHDLCCHITKQF